MNMLPSTTAPPFSFLSDRTRATLLQPPPPPQLPALQLTARHQDPTPASAPCPHGRKWDESNVHSEQKLVGRWTEDEMDEFVNDMGSVMRREFDVWVEHCWTESFHHVFTQSLPALLISLIQAGSSPTFLRRSVIHGGPSVDTIFQTHMLSLLYAEHDRRLAGQRPIPTSTAESSAMATAGAVAAGLPGMAMSMGSMFGGAPGSAGAHGAKVSGIDPGANAVAHITLPRDGVCFHELAHQHRKSGTHSDDNHSYCLCQLTTCLQCFKAHAQSRRGPITKLPHELSKIPHLVDSFGGEIETLDEALNRTQGPLDIPVARDPKTFRPDKNRQRAVPLFPHPQMTDVLAVEEHMRWRLREMGAPDAGTEARYSAPLSAAGMGMGLPDGQEDDWQEDDHKPNGAKPRPKAKGKAKLKGKMAGPPNGIKALAKRNGVNKDDEPVKSSLPAGWLKEPTGARNMALVLTFRHFVKLLHETALGVSPFSYATYAQDVAELAAVHPLALYRRLVEPSLMRRKTISMSDVKRWQECMDKWADELGAREKTRGNALVGEGMHPRAVVHYTRAISLDGKKTVYYSNRALALNTIGQHEIAERDCWHILAKDAKNGKALYQRAIARKGMGRWREAEFDLLAVLKLQPANDSAKNQLQIVRKEVAKLPKLRAEDVLDF